MGMFDRPAGSGAIEVVKAAPTIGGLTSNLQGLSHKKWRYAVHNLRAVRLLDEETPYSPGTLDCHPLIREHFAERLEQDNPDAWREAHSRLCEYYRSQAKEYPDTVEEMVPLYAAVAHGCQAGRYEEALNEVFRRRIQRGDEKRFSWRMLGLYSADVAALSGFFEERWSVPLAGLSDEDKAFVLYVVAYALRSLGRATEAVQPMEAGMKVYVAREDWLNAAVNAVNLEELLSLVGDLSCAQRVARESTLCANMSETTLLENLGYNEESRGE